MAELSSKDLDNLSNRLFQMENGAKPGQLMPSAQDMAQLLREARLAIEQLSGRLQTAADQLVSTVSDLEVEREKRGVWK